MWRAALRGSGGSSGGALWRGTALGLGFGARHLSSSSDSLVDAVVVGAGVVGLAVGRALALQGKEVIVLEAAGAVGTETSSRNSEVIHAGGCVELRCVPGFACLAPFLSFSAAPSRVLHSPLLPSLAGIYYPPGSLKDRLCAAGKAQLYAFCAEFGVPHARLGKLLVATSPAQLPALRGIQVRARLWGGSGSSSGGGGGQVSWTGQGQRRVQGQSLAIALQLQQLSSTCFDSQRSAGRGVSHGARPRLAGLSAGALHAHWSADGVAEQGGG